MLRTRLTDFFPLHLDGEGDPSGPGTATVVPAAPSEVERRNDSQPGLRGDTDKSALSTALREFRDAVNRGEIALDTQQTSAPAAQAAATESATTEPGAEPDAAAAAAAEAGTEGEAGAEGEGEAEGGDAGAADPLLEIELVPRQGQEPIKIVAEDQAVADALRNMRNLAGRTQAAETRAREAHQRSVEWERFEQMVELDPVGVVVDRMDPRFRVQVAEQLLAQDGVLEGVLERIERWQTSADARVADQARFELARRTAADTVAQRVSARDQQRTILDTITSNVGLIAELVPAHRAERFRDDCLGDISAYIRQNRHAGPLPPELLPRILTDRLELYGVKPDQAVAALSTDVRPSHTPPKPRPKGPAAVALAATPAAQRATANGQQFLNASRVRRATAAATPAAGAAVTVPANAKPPKGAGVKGTIQWLRGRMTGQGAPR